MPTQTTAKFYEVEGIITFLNAATEPTREDYVWGYDLAPGDERPERQDVLTGHQLKKCIRLGFINSRGNFVGGPIPKRVAVDIGNSLAALGPEIAAVYSLGEFLQKDGVFQHVTFLPKGNFGDFLEIADQAFDRIHSYPPKEAAPQHEVRSLWKSAKSFLRSLIKNTRGKHNTSKSGWRLTR